MFRKLLEKFWNRGSQNLSTELQQLARPCDGCGRMPILNPRWLTKGNPRWSENRKYVLGCPSIMWGGCEVYETAIEAIENWNYHVGLGGHNCYGSKKEN